MLIPHIRLSTKVIQRVVAVSAEELGPMSKNNLRGMTLALGPMWGD